MPALTEDLVTLAPLLRADLDAAQYRIDAIAALLGAPAHAALGRGEPVPARRASRGAGPLGTMIRLFLIGDAVPRAEVAAALPSVGVDRAVAAGLLVAGGGDGEDRLRAGLDLRPIDLVAGEHWVLSDPDADQSPGPTPTDHVIGVGQATLSLLRAIPTTPAGSVLDLGTGSGVAAFDAAGRAEQVVATDVNPRALLLTRAGAALNGLSVNTVAGPWFEPVAGRRFDRIVANPPFVVGAAAVEHTYRDSGLALDQASATVISGAPAHLTPGGTAVLLASWVHRAGEDWRDRVAGWLPDHGIDAWVVQRDVADPELYVGTWLRDGGHDQRTADGAARAEKWLDLFAGADVEAIGFGYVFLRATDSPTTVLAEELLHEFTDPIGDEATAYFDRVAWLRTHDVASARVRPAPGVALEKVLLAAGVDDPDPEADIWRAEVIRLHRGDGPRWWHELDDDALTLVTGLARGQAPVELVADLFAAVRGRDSAETVAAATAIVTDLIRHGLLLPVED